ncbi:hypothetical protein AX16_000276 [Volvariella volvacea WC 439]|nr:hypothetical protein AX16_000276 [Volvariella volvacea WC 439]
MSDKVKEFIEIPQQFIREGNQVRTFPQRPAAADRFSSSLHVAQNPHKKVYPALSAHSRRANRGEEFVQICRAVAVGFAVMGFIGYFVKLIHIPINNILVGGA